jgi:UDP-glucose 4-epimerase
MSDPQRVLVTGGCGFIGANLVKFLQERTDWTLRVVDDLRTGNRDNVADPTEVMIGDVADPGTLERALKGMDSVIHLASQTGVLPSVIDPRRDFQGNALPTFQVLEGCRKIGIERVVFASSGASVGDVEPPIHERVVPRPVSPYGAGKLAGEAFCQGYAGAFGMQTVVLRFSNVYGPFSLRKNNAIPNFIKRSLIGRALDIYGDGGQTRDFIYVDDLCAGIRRSLTVDDIGGEIFQLATGVETSVLELAKLVQEVVGSDAPINYEGKRAGEVYKSSVDISKARAVLDFDPAVPLAKGIARTADWYRRYWAEES